MHYDCVPLDHRIILDLVEPGATVLDLGCGSGELLYLLAREKKARCQGIEIDDQAIYDCVARGLCVFHGDIDAGLEDYTDKSFDYVILNQSLQQVRKLEAVLSQSLRVGKKVIIGFPNFGYYTSRAQIFFRGRTPVTPSLPYEWYDTPNLHFLSIFDFINYCRKKGITIEQAFFLNREKSIKFLPNLFAQSGLFFISYQHPIRQP